MQTTVASESLGETGPVLSVSENGRTYLTYDGWEAMKRTTRSTLGIDPLKDAEGRPTHGKVLMLFYVNGRFMCGIGDAVRQHVFVEVYAPRTAIPTTNASAISTLHGYVKLGRTGDTIVSETVNWPSPQEAMELVSKMLSGAVSAGDSTGGEHA